MVDSYLLLITSGLCITPHDPKLHPPSLCVFMTSPIYLHSQLLFYSTPILFHLNSAIILESLNRELK